MHRPRDFSLYQPGRIYDELPAKIYRGILVEQTFLLE